MRPALIAVVIFWIVGVVIALFFGGGNSALVRLLGAAGWTYLSVLIARKWVIGRA